MSPWEKIAAEYRGVVTSQVAYMENDPRVWGDTPIERVLYTALWSEIKYSLTNFHGVMGATKDYPAEAVMEWPPVKFMLVIERQKQLEGWRVDFLVHAFAAEKGGGGAGEWKSLIVECDGHDFHERNKDQAARDRSRDREFQSRGYTVFRFTGSEIWRDPVKCATAIVEWATKAQVAP